MAWQQAVPGNRRFLQIYREQHDDDIDFYEDDDNLIIPDIPSARIINKEPSATKSVSDESTIQSTPIETEFYTISADRKTFIKAKDTDSIIIPDGVEVIKFEAFMMRKIKKYIMHSAEDKVLNIDQKDIEQYLSEVKEAVEKDNYRLDRNARRQDNINLFLDYVIDETKAKEIILSLTVTDFSEILQNEHKGFEHEKLYVFGKDVTLLERNGTEEKTVALYIKFNKLENCFVIVISFHEQKYPLTYYFR